MDAVTLFLVCFNLVRCSAAADTITANQSIRDGGETIISARESFELGFFHPGASQNRYLGIWYKAIATGVVWVANRENPVHDNSSVLTITGDGRLQLQNGTGAVIWSSNSSRSVQNPVAQLLDTGNLVVRDANDGNPENYLWQSFDYPTDTLLPGMKFGIDLETGFDRYLSSWTSNDDPAPGDFTYRCDVRGYPQYFLLNGSTPRFRIGSWNGIGFSGLPVVRQNSVIRFNFVLNQREVYYSYDLLNASLASRLVLSQTGVAQRWTWLDRNRGWQVYLTTPMDNCDTYGLCGAYGSCNIGNSPFCGCLDKFQPRNPRDWYTADWSGGCVRRTALDCQNGDGFVKYPGVKLPDTRRSWYNVSMSLPECESECLRSCSCMAYANLNIRYGNGCLLWFDELIDIREFPESGQDLYIRMASSELEDSTAHGSNRKKGQAVKISLAILGGGVLLGLSLSLYFWKKKKNGQKQTEEGTVLHSSDQNGSNECQEDLELPLFDFSTIERVTNNFSINNKLGEGGYGPVYKGVFEDGREIAVKRLSRNSKQGLDEFKNEVLCIAKLQHRNLVKLLGCCIQRDEQILVYEYMPNKSLDAFIFDQTGSKVLDWPKRYRIINGIARGLLYLHQDSRLRIIHRDLKASNILLDKDMDPKISDFGMARSFGGNETEANTNRVVGTYGYMSPEYAVDGFFSIKSDVFSFGVLVLEIVSGRRNRGFHHPDHQHNLLGHAWRLYGEGRSVELIDISMKDSFYFTEVLRSIHVGLLCVQQCPEDRPSMATVVLMLGSEAQLPQPKQPGFYTERDLFKDVFSSSNKAPSGPSGPISACEMTITLLDAR